MADIKYEVIENIGVLSTNGRRTLELNVISWNGNLANYDLRRWQGDGVAKIMNKGITFNEDEARALYEILKNRFDEAVS